MLCPAYESRKNGTIDHDRGKDIEEVIFMEQKSKNEKMTRVIIHTPSANAKGNLHASGKLEVLQGSVMKVYAGKEMAKMKAVFEQLVEKKVLTVEEDGKAKFAKSYAFKNASEAASFLLHRGGDNSTAWHHTEDKKAAGKPVHAKQPAAKKPASKKPVHAAKPAAKDPKHTEKKKNPYPKKTAAAPKTGRSKRKDPRNPRGIRPQGNEAVKAAASIQNPGYVRFAGMGQSVKKNH